MKKWCLLLVCLLFVWILPVVNANAQDMQQAEDLTFSCTFSSSSGKEYHRLKDSKIRNSFETKKQENAYLQIDAEQPIGGLYIIWPATPTAWSLQALRDGEWTEVGQGAPYGFVHEYIAVPGDTSIRIVMPEGKKQAIKISEMRVFGQGEIPAGVQQWAPTPEKAELLLLVAHPDDEHIFFGGTIAYYASQQQKDVIVAYMTCGNRTRRTELLNGLWTAGLRTYPVIGNFPDKYCNNLKDGYKIWGKTKTLTYVTELFRKYKPEVVLTHDLKGEYGHGGHRVSGDAVMQCVQFAKDAEKYPESAAAYGTWEAKKVYLHLYLENQITLDWHQTIDALGGITALEAAQQGFACHVTQQGGSVGSFKFAVEDRGMYDNSLFGLYYSAVGMDTEKNDFFENLD